MKTALIVDNLRKRFGETLAVDGVSFEVNEGQVFGILGPNGAGKSTTLAIITGLVRADAGYVSIRGHDVRVNHKEAMKGLGVLVENPGFYGHLSTFDNLKLFGSFKKNSRSEIYAAMEKVGLAAHLQSKVRSYSQGMRKRLGLANALLGSPSLLILDEPTSSLDPKGSKAILDLIKTLSAENNTSIVISSNLLHDIEAVCDCALLIDKGKVVFCKSVSELLRSEEDSLIIRIEPMAKAKLALLSQTGVKSVDLTEEGSLRIVLSDISPAELNRKLIEQGFSIFELRPLKKTLQELFLQLKG